MRAYIFGERICFTHTQTHVKSSWITATNTRAHKTINATKLLYEKHTASERTQSPSSSHACKTEDVRQYAGWITHNTQTHTHAFRMFSDAPHTYKLIHSTHTIQATPNTSQASQRVQQQQQPQTAPQSPHTRSAKQNATTTTTTMAKWWSRTVEPEPELVRCRGGCARYFVGFCIGVQLRSNNKAHACLRVCIYFVHTSEKDVLRTQKLL